MTLFADLLISVFERRRRWMRGGAKDDRSAEALAEALIGGSGEMSGMTIAADILDTFEAIDDAGKLAFFHHVAEQMTGRPDALRQALEEFESGQTKASYLALMAAAEPPRQELVRRLNQAPGATERLVRMRAHLLRLGHDDNDLMALDLDFRHLFASWFNLGFLVLRPINWDSPASILEKIIAYEAVHEIGSWQDLRARLEPSARRCFAFFHPAMPDEPLIFVEVALTQGIASSIQNVLAKTRAQIKAQDADTALFYSISNCQSGLAEISFGNSLIKQVVTDLSADLPNLKTLVTLSPIPGLGAWLDEEEKREAAADPENLQQLTAQYLLDAKHSSGAPRDPVARFHLGNGAQVYAIHAKADLSEKGRGQSAGAMVNYLYDLDRIETNHEGFATDYKIAASAEVQALAQAAAKAQTGKTEAA